MNELRRAGRPLLLGWAALTAAGALALAIGIATAGTPFFYAFQGPADASRVEVKFLVFFMAWLWLGLALAFSQRPELLQRHAAFLVTWFLLGLGYLNVVRGPHAVEVKDFSNYYTAARSMRAAQPLTDNPYLLYLYPPLLATLLEPVANLEIGIAGWLFRFANYGALLLFAVLLYAVLRQLGGRQLVAALLVLVTCAFNVPIADTLASQQINLHLMNLVLAALLLLPRYPALSGAAVALGVHLKVYPVLLVVPFLALRQWRWLAGFTVTLIAVVVGTSAVNSFDYYRQFLHQLSALQEYGIRNASIAALLHNTARYAGVDLAGAERPLALALQLWLGALAVRWGWKAMKDGLLVPSGESAARVAGSAIIVLCVVMLLVSPSIWVHHCVLALLPALAVALAVRTVDQAVWLGVAYFLVFLVPVHEVFPFAYLRLAGLILFAWLFHRVAVAAAGGATPLISGLPRPAGATA